mmetsp:Transcript_47025/g.135941  ORF Transcript_47025/g.135941 Transcript_47025/m.135941 type:complete len:223 (-) Transcript_47025:813-1481(-)
MAVPRSATACVSSATSSVSFAMEASSSSTSACSVSTASVFSLRVCSFVASSVSHQPLCSASSLASSMRRTRRSLIIFFTLANGSSPTWAARDESTRLSSCWALLWRYRAAFACAWPGPICSERNAARDRPFAPEAFCTSVGRYFSACPETAALERISMALPMATSSSARSCCRDSKSDAFCWQVAVRSPWYFLSASIVVVVSSRSPWESAFACSFLAFISAF